MDMAEGFCEVSLGDYDGDEAQFYSERFVAGRKAHRCHECREAIPAGARQMVVVGRWDGEFASYRFCAGCWEVICEFSEHGKTFSVVWEMFRDEWANGATLQGCLNRLTTVAAKEVMTRQWRQWKRIDRPSSSDSATV